MSDLIQNKQDLINYLTSKPLACISPPAKVMVSTALRREVLIDEDQGKFTHNGKVQYLVFKSIGGGVYEASISKHGNPYE